MRYKETTWCTGALAEGALYSTGEDDKVEAKIIPGHRLACQAAGGLPSLAIIARISTLRPAYFLFLGVKKNV